MCHQLIAINILSPVSVTSLGYFWKVLVTIFLTKVAQIFGDFWAILKNITFKVKTNVATFWATFGKIWATFYKLSACHMWPILFIKAS